MIKRNIVFWMGLFLLLGSLPLGAQGVILKKDILVKEGEVQDNVISWGGNITVRGRVTESVMNFGGTILIEGVVEGDVVGIASRMELKPTSRIRGDVMCLAGSLVKDPGAFVGGDTIYFSTSEEFARFFKEGLFGLFGLSLVPLLIIFKLITLFLWYILALMLGALFPRQIVLASNEIRRSFGPVFGIGFLSIVIFTGLLLFSVFLSFILVGIPILLALIAAGVVIKIFGRVFVFYFLGDSIARAFGSKTAPVLLALVLGVTVFGVIGFVPVFGSLFGFVLSIIGWGAVIRTKFGTTENWFRKG
ncbi:MAG: hypothetical protein ACE5LV_06990 [Candidatus Aminicenantales bacterium]